MPVIIGLMEAHIKHHFGEDTECTPHTDQSFEVKLPKLPNWSSRQRVRVIFDNHVTAALRDAHASDDSEVIERVKRYLVVALAGKFGEWGPETLEVPPFTLGSEALDR